jgi:hypothetical protein
MLHLVFRVERLDLAYRTSAVWALGPKLRFHNHCGNQYGSSSKD